MYDEQVQVGEYLVTLDVRGQQVFEEHGPWRSKTGPHGVLFVNTRDQLLHNLILAKKPVWFINGDRTDLRLQNLTPLNPVKKGRFNPYLTEEDLNWLAETACYPIKGRMLSYMSARQLGADVEKLARMGLISAKTQGGRRVSAENFSSMCDIQITWSGVDALEKHQRLKEADLLKLKKLMPKRRKNSVKE